MKLIIILLSTLGLTVAQAAEDTKTITANGKTIEVRVPKSANIDCKDTVNADKTECKKPSRAMPTVNKPKETAPADAKKK